MSPPRQRASSDACLYLTKNKQNEVINKNSEDLNQMKRMFWARVKKRALSWGMFPDNWSANRVKYEVDMAYKNRVEFVEKGKTM